MPNNDFYDVAHANLRLSGTIVRLNDYPVYVQEVNDDWTASIMFLNSGKKATTGDIREQEGLDISPVPLGFCQIGQQASYLMRMPRRRTKQGLSEDSISSHDGNSSSVRRDNAYSKSLHNTITNVYPSLSTAISMLDKSFTSVGIARNWAVTRIDGFNVLMYKYYGPVGKVMDKQYILDQDYSYLQECLDQEVGDA